MSADAIARSIDAIRPAFYADHREASLALAQQALEAAQALACSIESQAPDGRDGHAWRQAQSLQARALFWLARCARRADQLDLGMQHGMAGVHAAQDAGDATLQCQLRAQLAHTLSALGQNDDAREEAYAALRAAVQSNDAQAQAGAWLALGQVHWAMQQWEDGHGAFQRSLAWAQTCGDRELIGLASNGMGAMHDQFARIARAAGRHGDAEYHLRRCGSLVLAFAECSRAIGDTYNTWSAEHNHACVLFGAGQHDAARACLHRQLDALQGEPGIRRQAALRLLGDIDLAEGKLTPALAHLTEALQIAEQLQQPMFAITACLSLVTAYERQGDLAAALAHHRRYHALYEQLASNKAQAHARAIAVCYDTEKARAVAEVQRLRVEQLEHTHSSLSLQAENLARASMEDALTGMANRRCFDQAMRDELPAVAPAQPYSLALLDIDHFKQINDHFSHLMGDEVLRRLGAILMRSCRREDLAARYGGEEFVLILRGLDPEAALRACERVRAAIESADWADLHRELRVTVSIGMAHHDAATADLSPCALLALADQRLYAAKHGGRNRVVDQ